MLPAASAATAFGPLNSAFAACEPSPAYPATPLPATVEIVPLTETFRTRLPPNSVTYRLPAASKAKPNGAFNCALAAAPPSPVDPAVPVPAKVVIVPVDATLRTRLLALSAIYTFPSLSTATPSGAFSCATGPLPASPPNPAEPLPAMVEIVPFTAAFRTTLLAESETYTLPSTATATPCGRFICALFACPPSPEKL